MDLQNISEAAKGIQEQAEQLQQKLGKFTSNVMDEVKSSSLWETPMNMAARLQETVQCVWNKGLDDPASCFSSEWNLPIGLSIPSEWQAPILYTSAGILGLSTLWAVCKLLKPAPKPAPEPSMWLMPLNAVKDFLAPSVEQNVKPTKETVKNNNEGGMSFFVPLVGIPNSSKA